MTLQLGHIFVARYRIDGILGAGGFGDVYLATDLHSERLCALKVQRATDEQACARFQREVAIVGRLRSRHTVALLDAGIAAGGVQYAVFEYIEGLDLSDVLRSYGQLTTEVTEHILRQLLDALAEAHGLGLLHRDIKPANIRVFDDGEDPWCVKLLDFGIARSTDGGHPNLTNTGELIGTPRYMSPEQLMDRPLTAASDIYSLGVVAMELLAGSDVLHGGRWGDQIDRLLTGYTPNIAGLQTGEELRETVLQMLRRDPRERLSSAEDVLGALDGVVAAGHHRSPLVEIAPRRAPPVALIAVLLVAVASATFFLMPRSEAPDPPPQRRDNPLAVKGPATPVTPQLAAVDVAEHDAGRSPVLDGCGQPPPFVGAGLLSFDSDHAYVPTTYTPESAHALIVLLHDDNQPPEEFLDRSGFRDLAERRGVIVLAPSSRSGRINPWEDESDNQSIVEAIGLAQAQLCVDNKRVFVVGQGSGGQRVHHMLCEDIVRAGAKNTHRLQGRAPTCDPKPLMFVNATASQYFPVEGGPNCAGHARRSVAEEELAVREKHGCREPHSVWFTSNEGVCKTWDCRHEFVSCLARGGGAWPGTKERRVAVGCSFVDPPKFAAAERVGSFFEQLDRRGCGVKPPFVGAGKLTAHGLDPWLTYIPENAGTSPMPLVLLLHQAEDSTEEFLETSGFTELADKHNFVVVVPFGGVDAWKNYSTSALTGVVAETSEQLCIDLTRQYVVAHGQGGRPAESLTCAPWVDAMATNSHRSSRMDHDCNRPIPHITLTGMRTDHEPVEGGANCRGHAKLSLAQWEKRWIDRNRCKRPNAPSFEYEGSECFEYEDCEEPFTSCHLDGGHGWPGSNRRPSDRLMGLNCDGVPPNFPTAKTIWKFFESLD